MSEVWGGQGVAPVRTAVIGLGYWGPNLVRNLQELPDAELRTVCDMRADQLQKIALRYPTVQTTCNAEDVFSDDEIEAVVIATPVSTHFPLAVAAIRSGKHVFVEKPLAVSSEEVARLIAAADEHERLLMPGHTFLYSPPVNTIRDLIANGELGDIYFISTSRVNLGLHQSDVSVAWDLGPHDFSILRYWLGEVPSRRDRVEPRLRHPGHPRRRVHQHGVRLGNDRPRRALVVGAEQAPPYDRGRIGEDGRLRRRQYGARFASSIPASCFPTRKRSGSTGSRIGRATSCRSTST